MMARPPAGPAAFRAATLPPVAPLPIATVAPRVDIDGPAPELADTMKALYEAKFRR